MVQWSDLLAALYLLGHDLTISSEMQTFIRFAQAALPSQPPSHSNTKWEERERLEADPALKSSCPVRNGSSHVDLIFTDIVGLRQMKRKIPGSLQVPLFYRP